MLYDYLVNGNEEAYTKLLEINNGLVYKVLKKIYKGKPEKIAEFLDEYGAVGFIGLSKAVNSFDVNRIGKMKFSTYASVCITNEVYMDFRKVRKEVDIVSFEEDIDDTENISLKDMLIDEENFVDDVMKENHDEFKARMIKKALSNLNEKERRAVELYFGFDGLPRTDGEVAKIMGISRSYISRLITSAKEKLVIDLNDFKEEYTTNSSPSKNKELIEKMNRTFYSLFGEEDEKIIRSRMFKLLNKDSLKVVTYYYGLDGKTCKDYDEIAEEMGITVDEVNEIIEEAILSIKSNRKYSGSTEIGFGRKYDDLVSKNGRDNVVIALEMIDDKKRKYLEMFFGINNRTMSCSDIETETGVQKQTIQRYIEKGLNDIENSLENKKDLLKRCHKFYDKFSVYTIDEVNLAISKLEKEDRDLIRIYYSLNGEFEKKSDIIEKYGLNKFTLQSRILRAIKRIENLLSHPDEIISKKDKFYKTLDGYSKDQINKALNSLNDLDREIVWLYYGLGEECLTQKEISDRFSIPLSTSSAKVRASMNKIVDYINREDEAKESFYKMFEGYTKEEVNEAVSMLGSSSKSVIELYYGLNEEMLSAKEISERIGISLNSVYVSKGTGIEKIKKILNKSLDASKKKPAIRINKYQELVDKYGEQKVIENLNRLKERNRNCIIEYYGINCEPLSQKDIALKYGLSQNAISRSISMSIEKIEDYILNPDKIKVKKEVVRKEKVNKYQELIAKYGEEKVKNAFSNINGTAKEIMALYYGIDCDQMSAKEVSEKVRVSDNLVFYHAKKGIEKLEEYLINPDLVNDKKNEFYSMFEGYSKEEVDEVISKLDEKGRNIISLIYGLNCDCLPMSKIADIYNSSQSNISAHKKRIIKRIRMLLENPNIDEEKEKVIVKKNNKYEELVLKYGEEKVIEGLNKLSERNRNIIKLYFGIECDSITQKEISEMYGLGATTVSALVKKCLGKIEDYIENPESYEDKKDKTGSERYLELVEKHGKENVDKVIEELDGKNQKIFKLYCGIDGKECSPKEIADAIKISTNAVYYNLRNTFDNFEKYIENPEMANSNKRRLGESNKYQELIEKYGKEKVNEQFLKLSSTTQLVLKYYFGIDGELLGATDISAKLNIKTNIVYHHVNNGIKNIEKYINNPSEENIRAKRKKVNKYIALVNKYGEKKVKEAFAKLNINQQEVLKMYFGIDEEEKSPKELSKIFNISNAAIASRVKVSLGKLEKHINNPNCLDGKKGSNKYNKLLEKYGKDRVEEAFSKLGEKTRKMMISYYGIDTRELSSSEIALLYNCKENLVYYHVSKGITKLEEYIINPAMEVNKIVKKLKKDTRLDDLKEKYGEKAVEDALQVLEGKNLDILKLYFGIGCNPMTQKQIGEKYNINAGSVWASIKRSIEKVADLLENPENALSKRQEFYNKFEGFTTEQVIEAIEKLDERERNVITDYRGLNGVKVLSGNGISEKYDIPTGNVYAYINKVENRIQRILYSKVPVVRNNENKQEEFYNNFKGYSKKQIINALNELNPVNREIMCLYYGIGCEGVSKDEICKRFSYEESTVNGCITYSFSLMKQILANNKKVVEEKKVINDRKQNFKQLIDRYGQKEVYEALNTLSESEKAFLAMYYTLGNIRDYSLDEISKKVGVDEKKLSVLEEKILEKVVTVLNCNDKKVLIDKMRKKFFEDVTIEDRSKIKDALKSLSESEIKWVATYYGLNGKDIMTIEEMSKRFNIDKKAVENYLARIMEKLNSYKPSEGR